MSIATIALPGIERYTEEFAANASAWMKIATDARRSQLARRLALRRAKLWTYASENLIKLTWLEAHTENSA
jgi:hypothetical protein